MKSVRGVFTVRRAMMVLLDFTCGAVSVATAFAIGDDFSANALTEAVSLACGVGLLVVVADTAAGSYRTIWRYTSRREATKIAISSVTVLASLLVVGALDAVAIRASTALLIALLVFFCCIGVRALRGWQIGEVKRRARGRHPAIAVSSLRRVLVAGAGETGLLFGRELLQSAHRGVELVGYLDDDPAKIGASVDGVPVLGPLSDVLALSERHSVGEVIVAMPSADADVVRSFVRQVEDCGLRVHSVPGVEQFVMGRDVYRPGIATLHQLLNGTTPPELLERVNGGGRHVLVTGGAGYIGSHLIRMLLDRGYHVRILDRFDYGRSGVEAIRHPRLEVWQGDICNSRDVSRAVRDVDAVVALAAIVGDPACNLDPEETINLNYAATKILIEACNFYGVRRLVFASSCSVYGASDDALLTEHSRLNPVSLYARTRVLSENVVFDRHGDVEPVVLRLATVFGLSPRMRFDLVVNTMTVRAVVDRKISVFGGQQWRPNVHCRDAARAFMMALEAPVGAVAGEIFNVGGDALNHRITDLAMMVARITGDVEVTMNDDVPDPRNYRVSFQKIRHVLGFEPEFSVPAGVSEVAAAVQRDPALQRHHQPLYHNVQALRQRLEGSTPAGSELAPA
jgi:nucleoside-diphosphate-sugar epimerase